MYVELQHPVHRALEERPVVAHHDDTAGQVVEEPFEAVEACEVEVVGGLVEQEHVEAAQEDRGQRGSSRLTTGKRDGRALEGRLRQPEVGDHASCPGIEIGSARREVPVEGGAVRVGDDGVITRGRQRRRGALEFQLGRGDAGSSGEELEQGLVTPVRLLRQVSDPQRRRRRHHRAPIGLIEPGEDAQQRRLANAVRADDPEPRARSDRQADPVEDEDAAP